MQRGPPQLIYISTDRAESEDSGARIGAVMLWVVVHERIGEDDFWNEMRQLD